MHTPDIQGQSRGHAFLADIVAKARDRVERLRLTRTLESLRNDALRFSRRSFLAALGQSPPAIIAELKKASPSKGLLRSNFDPVMIAGSYERGGAAALSIVTEPFFFKGVDQWIAPVRQQVALPILRKDFVIDPIQVYEAAALGADAVLLIARLLSTAQMLELRDAAESLGLDTLFEAHDTEDVSRINSCNPRIVGVNARNLDTFAVDVSQFAHLRPLLPSGITLVAESGIDSAAQIANARNLGFSAFLIGESLVTSDNPAEVLRALKGKGET